MRGRLATAASAVALIAGCAGSGDRIPTAPVPTIIRLTITPLGGGLLTAGASADIVTSGGLPPSGTVVVGAFAEYSNRTGRYVDAAWRSDDENTIAVVGSSIVGRRRGSATLTASFEGWTDTETFVVEGGIPGRWGGSYLVEECAASSGSMAEIVCGAPGRTPGLAAVGAMLPISMDITEEGDALTATLLLNPFNGTVSGKNRGGGFFTFVGSIGTPQSQISFFHWDALVTGDQMEGFIGYEIRIAGLPGLAQVAAKFANLVRQ